MLLDALAMEWRTLKVSKDPACPACGKSPKETPMSQTPEMTVEELKAKLDRKEKFILLDVREPEEYEQASIAGSTLIPLGTLPERLGELDKTQRLVVHCRSGGRSGRAVQFLRSKGFDAVNVAGGILAWAQRIDPTISPT
jgi:rhodanese-related sulfurtransferase